MTGLSGQEFVDFDRTPGPVRWQGRRDETGHVPRAKAAESQGQTRHPLIRGYPKPQGGATSAGNLESECSGPIYDPDLTAIRQ
jgi:hypothetical protein